MAFDPDAYIAQKSQAFDPDAYLAQKSGQTTNAAGEKILTAADYAKSVDARKGEKPGALEKGGFLQNAAGGLVRGAGSIGATLMTPYDLLAGNTDSIGNPERRAAMDSGVASVGANKDALEFKGGKLASEVMGTAGLGGAITNGARMGAAVGGKAIPAALEPVLNAIATGGMTTGVNVAPGVMPAITNMLPRIAGGAINGGATAGLVDPSTAGTGAVIGGALPVATKLAGVAGNVIKSAGAGVAKHVLGTTTGTGGNAISTAYQSGRDGGTNFLANMRGDVPMTDVLDSAKGALGQMRMDRGAQYRSGMADIAADKSVIDFTPIDKAVASIKSMGNYKGQVINKNASGTVDEISGIVAQWKGLDPAEFHTPEGLDALKQAISDVRDTTQFGTAARKAADTAYNAVKGEIVSQAPTYAKVMKDYSVASETLGEVERALSLGNKAAADTSMRKLQSLMRNNVNTNFGNRLGLANTLEQSGAEILPAVAGQSMSSWTPRGLQGLSASGIAGAGVMTANPLALAALPATSPRLMGELAYGVGAANRGVSNAGSAAQSKLMQLLGRNNAQAITLNQLAPLFATAPVLAASQR